MSRKATLSHVMPDLALFGVSRGSGHYTSPAASATARVERGRRETVEEKRELGDDRRERV